MAYKIIGENGEVKQHKGEDVLGSDQAAEVIAKAVIDNDKRIVEVVSSSDRQDRDGDRINQAGIDHQFAQSVLYAHDYGRAYMPIGKQLGHRTEEREGYVVTIETHQFNPPGAYELSDAAWKLVEFGSLGATSIGFIPKKVIRAESDDMRQEMGLGKYGVMFDAIEKLETSWVPVQSNRDAIREAFGKGIISRTEAKTLFPSNWHEINAPKHWAVGIELEGKDETEKRGTGETEKEKPETGDQEPESQVPETGNQKPETRNQEPETNTGAVDERLNDMEEKLGAIFEALEALKTGAVKPETAVITEAPEPDQAGNDQPENTDEQKTLSLDDDQVSDIAKAAAEIAVELMAEAFGKRVEAVVDKTIRYHLGKVD